VGEYSLGLPGFHGSEYAAVGGVLKSHSCERPKPITPAKPEWEIFKALEVMLAQERIQCQDFLC